MDGGWTLEFFCCSTEVVRLTQMVTQCFETVQSGDGHIQLYQLRDNTSDGKNYNQELKPTIRALHS